MKQVTMLIETKFESKILPIVFKQVIENYFTDLGFYVICHFDQNTKEEIWDMFASTIIQRIIIEKEKENG